MTPQRAGYAGALSKLRPIPLLTQLDMPSGVGLRGIVPSSLSEDTLMYTSRMAYGSY